MNTASASAPLYFTERGSGPPLLLIHGLMVTGDMFQPVMADLATRHRVIVPDLRGHGRSRGLGPPYTVARLAADLSRLLDHLNIGSAAVLGYSQGGTVAQQLALDDPERCGRLVLACTYAFNMASFRERLEGLVLPQAIRILGPARVAGLLISQVKEELGKERAAWLAGMMAEQDRSMMITAMKETLAFDSRRRLAEISCPTLIIAGSRDRGVPIHHAMMLQDGIPTSQMVIITDAGHQLLWTHTEEFLRVTEEFLGRGRGRALGVPW